MNKEFYYRLCISIMNTAEEEKRDYRDIVREWIMLFESAKVVGWNRDEFLEEMIKCKEVKNG